MHLQLACAASLMDYVVALGSDISPTPGVFSLSRQCSIPVLDEFAQTSVVQPFQRAMHSTKKLRHFRFMTVGFVAQMLGETDLIHKVLSLHVSLVIRGRFSCRFCLKSKCGWNSRVLARDCSRVCSHWMISCLARSSQPRKSETRVMHAIGE